MSNVEITPDIMEEARSRMKYVTHKGMEIEINDFTNLRGDRFASIIKANTQISLNSDKRDLLGIIDVSNSYINKETLNAFNESGEATKHLIAKTAVVGVTGLKKIFLNVVNKFTKLEAKPFDTIEEAKDWLVK